MATADHQRGPAVETSTEAVDAPKTPISARKNAPKAERIPMPTYAKICALAKKSSTDLSLVNMLLAKARPIIILKANAELDYAKCFFSKYNTPATLFQVAYRTGLVRFSQAI
jgi:hypothetical protein